MSMDIDEYKQLITKLRPSLLAISRRITGNGADAEDVVQDVCLKIWHKRVFIGQYINFEAYIVSMTKNLSIDKIRGRRIFSDESTLYAEETADFLPDRQLEEKDASDTIRQMINLLPPLQRRILRMKDLEGYDTDEIASLAGINVEAVRNNLSRGRKRLRELFLENQAILKAVK